ncbi:MAG: chromosome segregation SMC family protein [Gemmatimonadota bacterium]
MKVKSITLQGFKSFADRTRLEFHDGITAVVGPNGCGKSNISDALRWVLGEQRPTAIRGSRMEEAIFGGSKERRPIHRAEVALELANEDRTLPLPYSEVVIGRTVYRGGESEYTINGAACRLKDIHDLCRDTGLGTNAYAIIEARMIDAILSDRAEERRALFEEAAGIGRYKDRRRAALRRLEQAESDLQRLEDVLSEIRSKVRSLARQRGRAERFGKLRTRRLQLEVAVADARLAADDVRLEEARARLESLRRDHPGEQADLRTLETEAEALRLRLTEDERERADLARSLDATRKRLEERERERLVASERAVAARDRLEALARELERLAERRRELDEEAVETGRALDLAGRSVSDLAELEGPLKAEVAQVEGVLEQARAAEEAARESLGGVLRELGSLEAGREAATERLTERVEEIERRRAEIEDLRAEADHLREERATAEREANESSERERRLDRKLAACRAEVDELREAGRELRAKVAGLEGDLSAMRAKQSSLADFLASGGGVSDTVRELLAAAGSIPGIEGVLTEFIRVPSELAGAVEAHLGLYLHGLVVKDWESVAAVRRWLADREDDSGVLLLPLDPGPRPSATAAAPGSGDLLSRVEAIGAGARWVRALLAGVSLGRKGSFAPAAGAWTLADGSGQDPWGAVRLGPLAGARGALTRRAELEELTRRSASVERELEAARQTLEQTELSLARTSAR